MQDIEINRTNHMRNNGTVITIAQQKGGAGKTTLASHLAIALCQKKNRVAVLDIDPQGSLTHWYHIRSERFGEDYTGIFFTNTSGWKINSELSSLKSQYDYIIIDSPPHVETDAKSAIRASDLVLIPVQPSPTDIWATKATVELCNSEKIENLIVINRVTHNSKLADEVTKAFKKNVCKTQISNRVAFASSLLEGRCVMETQPKGPASDEIKALVSEVLAKLSAKNKKKAA